MALTCRHLPPPPPPQPLLHPARMSTAAGGRLLGAWHGSGGTRGPLVPYEPPAMTSFLWRGAVVVAALLVVLLLPVPSSAAGSGAGPSAPTSVDEGGCAHASSRRLQSTKQTLPAVASWLHPDTYSTACLPACPPALANPPRTSPPCPARRCCHHARLTAGAVCERQILGQQTPRLASRAHVRPMRRLGQRGVRRGWAHHIAVSGAMPWPSLPGACDLARHPCIAWPHAGACRRCPGC